MISTITISDLKLQNSSEPIALDEQKKLIGGFSKAINRKYHSKNRSTNRHIVVDNSVKSFTRSSQYIDGDVDGIRISSGTGNIKIPSSLQAYFK